VSGSDKTILVTGGAGFIGSHLVEDLVSAGYRVTVLDDLSSGWLENLEAVKDRIHFVEGSILDERVLRKVMEGQRFVSHMAAQLEITKCVKSPLADLESNTIGTLRVLEAAHAAGVEKLVNASSACVYGQAQHTPQSEDGHPTNPNWEYGVSKLAAEKYTRLFWEAGRMKTVSLRFAIIYGEREWCGRVITMFLRRALRGAPPVVFGAGDQERDFTHVEDLVRLHRLALERPEADGQVFNVSTGLGTNVAALSELCREVTGIEAPVVWEKTAEGEVSAAMPDRVRLPQELKTMVLDPARAKKLLGWEAKVALRDGLRREWDWIQKQPSRWDELSI
jgi:UDP-glucose 4-epimerase